MDGAWVKDGKRLRLSSDVFKQAVGLVKHEDNKNILGFSSYRKNECPFLKSKKSMSGLSLNCS